MVSAVGQLTKTQLSRPLASRVVFRLGASQGFSGQVLNLRDGTAHPCLQNQTHPNVEMPQRPSMAWEPLIYNARELR